MLSQVHIPVPGDLLADRYELIEQLGIGGFGVVYRGRDVVMKRDVALKILLPHLAMVGGVEDRFRREATLASDLNNPHTIRLYEYGSSNGMLYIAMELLKGRELEDALQQDGPMSPQLAVKLILEILDSLAEAHGQGIVHRDLKPSNIFLCEVGRRKDYIKVLDFGIAKAINEPDDSPSKLTATGQTLGTPYYMAPEQVRQGKIGSYTDLYAMGLILVEMMTGEVTVQGSSAIEIVMIHASGHPIQIPSWIEESVLGPVVRRAIDKDYNARFASPEEMIEALEALDLSSVMVPEDLQGSLSDGLFEETGELGAIDAQVKTNPNQSAPKAGRVTHAETEAVSSQTPDVEPDFPPEVFQKKKISPYVWVGVFLVLLSVAAALLLLGGEEKTSNDGVLVKAGAEDGGTKAKGENIGAEQGSPGKIKVPAQPIRKVSVIIESVPSGATLFRNGKEIGKTPFFESIESSPKSETWILRLNGYRDRELIANLDGGMNESIPLQKTFSAKAAAEKLIADKVAAAESAASKSAAAEKAATDKIAAEEAAAAKLESDKTTADRRAAKKAKRAAAKKAAAKKAAAEKAATEKAAKKKVLGTISVD